MKVDIVIIGAGIAGAALAQRYASEGSIVILLEKRDHIAGNCFDFIVGNVKGYEKLFYTRPIDRFFNFKQSLENDL